MLQLKYTLEKIENYYQVSYDRSNYFAAVLKTTVFDLVIDTKEIKKLLSKENVVKIKDETRLAYNINEIILRNDIQGVFVKKVLEKYERGLIDKETMEKVIETGLEVL